MRPPPPEYQARAPEPGRKEENRGRQPAHDDGRGRQAGRPGEIPARGWRDIGLRVKNEMTEDNISIVAAGVAYYGFFAIFPTLAALVMIYGLFADPAQVPQHVSALAALLPGEGRAIIEGQLTTLAGQSGGALSLGLLISLALALWSASKGVGALMTALNIAYDEEERRGFFYRTAVTLLFTVGGIVLALVALIAVAGIPALLGRLGLPDTIAVLLNWLRWPILAIIVLGALAVVYRYGPSRQTPRWRWVSWGSAIATVLWLAGSAGFSFYVSRFGSYNKTYGSMAAIAILLTWFLLSSYVVIMGAELNGEMEHQTERDTTTGPEKAMGERGAIYADTVGESP